VTLSMGIIGCGSHALHHAQNYGGDFETHGVWDPKRSAMRRFGGKKYPTLEALLADEKIVAVSICSPDKHHLGQTEMALAAGKHVFCEKPFLVPGEDIARLEAAFAIAEEKKLAITSCHPRRFDRPIEWLQQWLRKNSPARFGAVISFEYDFSYHAPTEPWKHARSLLLDHVCHEVDLMNALFGMQGFDALKLHDSFNHYHVVGKRDDGLTFSFRGTRRLRRHVYPEWCRVRFDRGEIVLDMMMGLAYQFDHNQKLVKTVPGLAIDYSGRLQKVMTDFSRQITGMAPGYLSPREMIMNATVGIVLQNAGVQHISMHG
jgi:predicted dehydrogenase